MPSLAGQVTEHSAGSAAGQETEDSDAVCVHGCDVSGETGKREQRRDQRRHADEPRTLRHHTDDQHRAPCHGQPAQVGVRRQQRECAETGRDRRGNRNRRAAPHRPVPVMPSISARAAVMSGSAPASGHTLGNIVRDVTGSTRQPACASSRTFAA